jgi:DNA-binding NarL/FixJ family response regulator
MGVDVELHAWESIQAEVRASLVGGATRYIVVVFDEPDGARVAEGISALVDVGGVRVAVVTQDPAASWWGVLLEEPAVDVIGTAASLAELAGSVQRFTSGERLLAPERRRELRADWAEALDNRRRVVELVQTLSPQQLRVLELLAFGHRVREVAAIMGVADGTVRSHVRALRSKLGARTQLEAVAMLKQVRDPAVRVPRQRTAGSTTSARGGAAAPR